MRVSAGCRRTGPVGSWVRVFDRALAALRRELGDSLSPRLLCRASRATPANLDLQFPLSCYPQRRTKKTQRVVPEPLHMPSLRSLNVQSQSKEVVSWFVGRLCLHG